jgi:hypothetical protein
MDSFGTTHHTVSQFADALANPEVQRIVYAIGDLACSARFSAELGRLREEVWQAGEASKGFLTQRRLPHAPFRHGGACFEYIFTKAQ